MQANRGQLTVYPWYVFLSSFVSFRWPVCLFRFAESFLLSLCHVAHLLRYYSAYPSHAPLMTTRFSSHRKLHSLWANVPCSGFFDLLLVSVLAVPMANHRSLFQLRASHRYYQHPAGLFHSQRNNPAKCDEGFWDSIGHPFLRFCLMGCI